MSGNPFANLSELDQARGWQVVMDHAYAARHWDENWRFDYINAKRRRDQAPRARQ